MISPALRTLWPELLDDDAIPTAYALDSILIEVFFVGGPLFTAVVVTILSPAYALGAAAAMVLVGTLWFATLEPSRTWRGEIAPAGWAGPLHAVGMRTLLVGAVGAGASMGAIEVALPGFGAAHGNPSLGGPLIAAWSLGSAAGGLAYGALADRLVPRARAWVLLNAALAVATLPLLLAPSVVGMFLLAPLSGCLIAPSQATQNLLVGDVAPPGTITEAYSWVLMGLVVGIAAGNGMAGLLIDAVSWRAAIAAGTAVALAAAAWAYARAGTLRPVVAS
jgi:predicted MFS family arabinose efflux permease